MMQAARRALLALLLIVSPGAVADGVILLYHRFGEDRFPATSIGLGAFEAQLEHLAEGGYRVVPLAEIADAVRTGRPVPDRTVAITVDDAYRSVFDAAWPRLRARGWPFTVFVATDPVDRGLPGFMTWGQMREMAAAGVAFANHGRSHDSLLRRPGEDEAAWRARVRAELLGAQARLEAELGVRERLFAYPYGEFDAALAGLVRGLGFVAFGQHSGPVGRWSDPRALPRFPVGSAGVGGDEFRLKVAARALPVARAEPWDPRVPQGSNPPRLRLVLAPVAGPDPARLACYAGGQGAIPVRHLGGRAFEVVARAPLPPGRARYTCTAPGADGRWYWYSHPWIIPPAPSGPPG
ncbi:polysaccharide deacetylase family protein [Inmirania thermothiophila]|uniref:Polysaccharide deacetylase n=1 Tax=Inmirania thermothiophila TaxID=1750597 RepID=A0A3N1XS80_9GAMM|nr:polysaccharide deacetylase family protein [Inmirania thermothiophila]ROR29510.1 polysaccharide deacetylase [Inmirania thermothiophila]